MPGFLLLTTWVSLSSQMSCLGPRPWTTWQPTSEKAKGNFSPAGDDTIFFCTEYDCSNYPRIHHLAFSCSASRKEKVDFGLESQKFSPTVTCPSSPWACGETEHHAGSIWSVKVTHGIKVNHGSWKAEERRWARIPYPIGPMISLSPSRTHSHCLHFPSPRSHLLTVSQAGN